MKEVNIKIPEGYIIDKKNSNLDKGIITFKKGNNLPNSWEKYYKKESKESQLGIDTAIHHLKHYLNRFSEKYIALFKLELLRDCYRQGWKPDYTNPEEKHIIIKKYNNLETYWFTTEEHYFLSFQSEKIRDEFYNNFKDLIEKTEDLI